MENKPIKIWSFQDAPKKYREMSENGGDEDWIALLPSEYNECYIGFLEEGTPFGRCNVDKYKLKNNDMILIGSHA